IALAQIAEQLGYVRYWFAEHHNMANIATSAPEVLIAHAAAVTSRIRLGAGGIMVPNHAPLHVVEVFRTLEALHPGRIDLGLGRAAPRRSRRGQPAARRAARVRARRVPGVAPVLADRADAVRRAARRDLDAGLDPRRRDDRGPAQPALRVRRPLRDARGRRGDRALPPPVLAVAGARRAVRDPRGHRYLRRHQRRRSPD